MPNTKPYREIIAKGNKVEVKLNLHPAQLKAWDSKKRIVAMLVGTQGGKTCFGADWLKREIEECGDGDYLVVTATYPLLEKKLEGVFLDTFRDLYNLGAYNQSKKIFQYHNSPTRILICSATNPESIESATAKAAWLDEAGQEQFRHGTWDAVLRRLSLFRGRILITTTLYEWGWLKNEIYDKWEKGDENIEVIQADSLVNPAFPKKEYYERKKSMPSWKFDLFYRGIFTKPAGLIYDAFNESACLIKRRELPFEWNRYVGMDFGTVTTAAMFYAVEPTTGNFFAYREYVAGGKSAAEHAEELKMLSQGERITKIVGGAKVEAAWRESFTNAGWRVLEPAIKDVEVGIDKVYAFHKANKLFVFDDLEEYIRQKQSYSRKIDSDNQPIPNTIQDKERYHLMDAERYIISEFNALSTMSSDKIMVRSFG